MDTQKISKILNLIEIAENNLKTAQILIKQLYGNGYTPDLQNNSPMPSITMGSGSDQDGNFLEIVEGNFDGENMIGDDGKIYNIPANYASKTKLVVGDRMKRILTDTYREVYKVILKATSKRVVGIFTIDESGDFIVIVDSIPSPIKVLKASITFAMKQQNLKTGDSVAVLIPANSTPTWGAFDTVVKHGEVSNEPIDFFSEQLVFEPNAKPKPSLDNLKEQITNVMPATASIPNPFDSLDEFRV